MFVALPTTETENKGVEDYVGEWRLRRDATVSLLDRCLAAAGGRQTGVN